MEYGLMDTRSGKCFGKFPNKEGAMLSALFHVENGDAVIWEPEKTAPVQVASMNGNVNGKRRFRVYVR